MHAESHRFHVYERDPLPEIRCSGRKLSIGIDGAESCVEITFGNPMMLMEFAARLFREAVKLEAKLETAPREVA